MSGVSATTSLESLPFAAGPKWPRTLVRLGGRLARLALGVAVGLAIGLVLAVTAPPLFGYRPLTVLTGSMRPTIEPGDVVVDQYISPLDARPGELITFNEPGSNRLITHRLQSSHPSADRVQMVTRGDANDTVERWSITRNGRIGRVVYHLPKMGYVLSWMRSPLGRTLLIASSATLLLTWELTRIWRPRRKREEVDEAGL